MCCLTCSHQHTCWCGMYMYTLNTEYATQLCSLLVLVRYLSWPFVYHSSYSTSAMSAVREPKAAGSGIVSLAAGTTSSSSGHRKSSGGSGSPVSASSLPPTELFPMEGLLEELLHQEAELWRRNELLMQSLRRECIKVQLEWAWSTIGKANSVRPALLWYTCMNKWSGHHPFLLLCVASAKPLLIWMTLLGIFHWCYGVGLIWLLYCAAVSVVPGSSPVLEVTDTVSVGSVLNSNLQSEDGQYEIDKRLYLIKCVNNSVFMPVLISVAVSP